MTTKPDDAKKMDALDSLVGAASRLNAEWDRDGYAEFLDAGYPSCLPSFDEFVLALGDWAREARAALDRQTPHRLTVDLTKPQLQHLVECVFTAADADDESELSASVYRAVLAASRATGYAPTGFNGPLEPPTQGQLAVGTRVRLTHDVERFPHFIAKAGSEGTVTCADLRDFSIVLDLYLPGAKEWDNQIIWTADDNPMDDIEEVR